MTIRQRLAAREVFLAVRLAAFGDWWAARAAARLRRHAKFVSQGCAASPAHVRPVETAAADQASGAECGITLAGLGAKLVPASHPEGPSEFKDATVKSFTGGDPLRLSRIREEFVEVDPVFRLRVRRGLAFNDRGGDRE